MIFLSSIILTINFSSLHYPSPASQQGNGCRTSQRSLLSSAEETRLSTSNLGKGAHFQKSSIFWAPCKDGQITSEFFRPLVSPGMEGMLIHIPKPGKRAIKKLNQIIIFFNGQWLIVRYVFYILNTVQAKKRYLHFEQGRGQQGPWRSWTMFKPYLQLF